MELVAVMSSWRIHGRTHVAALRSRVSGCTRPPKLPGGWVPELQVCPSMFSFSQTQFAPSLPFPSPQRVHDMHANAEQFDRKTELSFKYLQVRWVCTFGSLPIGAGWVAMPAG